jgi:hypothetical protein
MAIKKIWVLIGSFLLGAPMRASADPAKAAPQKVDESTAEDDKAAVQQAASEADQWAAKHKSNPVAPKPAVEEADQSDSDDKSQQNPAPTAQAAKPANPAALPGVTAPSTASPAPAPEVKATPPPVGGGAKPAVPRPVGLNEMKGKLLSISNDPKSFRLIVEGGYNVEFTYDPKTSVVNGGDPIKLEALGYNDQLIVRYAGKDLYAVEIERVSKAPRPE